MDSQTKQCECGKFRKLTKIKTIGGIRDIDTLYCTCGRELIDWSGAHMWTKEEIPSRKSRFKEVSQ